MRRLLIISPHFPPVNAPDMQRVRQALPYLEELGWEPTVVAVAPESIAGATLDPLLESTYPAAARIIRVRGISPGLTRRFGFDNLWLRCGRRIRRAAESLLASTPFDAVLFSTTQFNAFSLGPRWLRWFGVPYVLDYQDPWVTDYYSRTGVPPPGGRLKYGLSQRSAIRREPIAVAGASAIISVSPDYIEGLAGRYPNLDRSRMHVLPFGAEPRDFELAAQHQPQQPIVNFADGRRHMVCAGRCVEGMYPALRAFFCGFRLHLAEQPEMARQWMFHFIGTDYAPPPRGREWVKPIAREEGVDGHVVEHSGRVPYFDALHYLQRADALLALGSDDPGYNASKLFPYLFARRPLLLIFHSQSPVRRLHDRTGGGVLVCCDGAHDIPAAADQIFARWFADSASGRSKDLNEMEFAPFTASELTRKLVGILDRMIVR